MLSSLMPDRQTYRLQFTTVGGGRSYLEEPLATMRSTNIEIVTNHNIGCFTAWLLGGAWKKKRKTEKMELRLLPSKSIQSQT